MKKDFLHAEHSKSLLSVPSICIDNLDSASSISTIGADSSAYIGNYKHSELDTVSMIVRNVEAADSLELELQAQKTTGSPPKVKHDFYHDLKGSIQDKLHLSSSIKKKENTHESAKTKEILHDLRENMSGKFHQIAERIHHIHLPHIHHAHEEESLVAQAMQTILLEKFNIVEASSGVHPSTSSDAGKRKSSASSLQSIKQKFNLFQRPRRSVELPNEMTSLKSISEINTLSNVEMTKSSSPSSSSSSSSSSSEDESSSIVELKIHEETLSEASLESTITVLVKSEQDLKAISKEDLKLSVRNFDSFLNSNNRNNNSSLGAFADTTNNKPLHESLLSLSRNELLSVSPSMKTHARTESIGCKVAVGSPSKQPQHSGSLPGKDILSNICRRSSDSDLSITPKGEFYKLI